MINFLSNYKLFSKAALLFSIRDIGFQFSRTLVTACFILAMLVDMKVSCYFSFDLHFPGG